MENFGRGRKSELGVNKEWSTNDAPKTRFFFYSRGLGTGALNFYKWVFDVNGPTKMDFNGS